MICYQKLVDKLAERKFTSYTAKKYGIIGQASYQKIMQGGNIDMRTLDSLCRYLDCQPGDLLEYVPDDQGVSTPENVNS